ncbi:MAG TPA: CarD family transcriptional regulator [Xanthobacteraceae bacterium]|nr:CarD family transcriptional regulator [Xanthobacteraceae bacterium]
MAGKSRQSLKKASKKSAAGSSRRRTSHVSRGAVRRAAPKAKSAGHGRSNGKKVTRRMINTKKSVARPAAKKTVERAVPKKMVDHEALKKATQRQGFKTNEFIVYPAHGVGQITAIEEQEVAGYKLELFVINFVKDKMTLRVPTAKIASVGMRKLADPGVVRRALETLKGRARIKRTMWSRRAQEYEAKINSGDIVAIAEVVRDLYRSESQPEQSYSERQLYEAALDRLSREIAAVQRLTETEAVKEIEAALAKGPRRGPKPEGDEIVTEKAA